MTVSNTNKKNTYTGDGATTTFAFTFKVIKSADVLVKIKDVSGLFTTKTEGTHYNVTGTLPGTGNVVFTAGNIPISTDTIILTRDMDFLQETDLVEKDAFPSDTVEQQLDQLTMQDLQLKEVSDRVVQLDETVDTDTVSATLPTPSANKFIAWNDDATALEGVTYTAVGLGSLLDDPSPQCAADLDMNGFNLVFDDNKGVKDDQGNELLWFQNLGTNTAVNHFEITNAATGSNPLFSVAGDDANIGMNFISKGTGVYTFQGSADTAAEVRLGEDTDNGVNYIGLKAPAAVTSNTTFVLPDGDGTANQALATDGSGNLVFKSAPDLDGGVWKKITTTTASSDATINFTGLDSTYKTYWLVMSNVQPATDNVSLLLRVGTGAGPTYDTGSNYKFSTFAYDSSGSGSSSANNSTNSINIVVGGQGNTSQELLGGNIFIYNPSDSSYFTYLTTNICLRDASGNITNINGSGMYAVTTAVTAIRLYYGSGDVSIGEFTLYGLK